MIVRVPIRNFCSVGALAPLPEHLVLITDKAPSMGSAFKKLQKNGLYTKTEHRTVKYLNNLIEQDHRPIKRRNKFYRSLRTASTTIKSMEAIREIYKKTEKTELFLAFRSVQKSMCYWGFPLKNQSKWST